MAACSQWVPEGTRRSATDHHEQVPVPVNPSVTRYVLCKWRVPGGIRTHDLRFSGPSLYPLSYRDCEDLNRTGLYCQGGCPHRFAILHWGIAFSRERATKRGLGGDLIRLKLFTEIDLGIV